MGRERQQADSLADWLGGAGASHLNIAAYGGQYGVRFDEAEPGCAPSPTQHGLSSNKMARITSECDAMRPHAHQMALITSDRAPSRPVVAGGLFVNQSVSGIAFTNAGTQGPLIVTGVRAAGGESSLLSRCTPTLPVVGVSIETIWEFQQK